MPVHGAGSEWKSSTRRATVIGPARAEADWLVFNDLNRL